MTTPTPAPAPVNKKAELKAKRDESFRWYWLAWAVLALVSFLVPELYVATTGRMDLTLSDTLRAVLGIDPPSKLRNVGAGVFGIGLLAGAATLALHITAGWL